MSLWGLLAVGEFQTGGRIVEGCQPLLLQVGRLSSWNWEEVVSTQRVATGHRFEVFSLRSRRKTRRLCDERIVRGRQRPVRATLPRPGSLHHIVVLPSKQTGARAFLAETVRGGTSASEEARDFGVLVGS